MCVCVSVSLREKCPYSKLFRSAFSRIRTEYGEIRIISPHSVRMRENMDQNNYEYGHFLRSSFYVLYHSPIDGVACRLYALHTKLTKVILQT